MWGGHAAAPQIGGEKMPKQLLKMESISKNFPGVKALDNAYIDLFEGEVLGLLGENGAGKSTLMNVLGGIFKPDAGSIFIDEQEVTINGVLDSQAKGIGFIHQELALEPYMTIAENIFLGREKKDKFGAVSKKIMNEAAKQYLEIVGLDIDPRSSVSRLSTGQQQLVEVAKAFSLNARIIVMDEPTSSLSEKEVRILFKTVKELQKRNIGIIYISHKLSEIFELTDRITVMRDGSYIGTQNTKDTTEKELVHMMVGRELENYYVRTHNVFGDVSLEVRNMNAGKRVKDCSFQVRKGEILGFYGLIGAGRSELLQAVMGLYPSQSGEIYVNGKLVKNLTPLATQKLGLALVPEDRKTQGLFLENTVSFNSSLAVLDKFISKFRVNRKIEKKIVNHGIESLSIKTPSADQRVGNLSGGNQQKVVLAKWLATNPQILILDEPTRGIDVGAKAEIYKIINDLAASGIAIILISSELNEIINMCDTLAIMHNGQIAATFCSSEFDQDVILHNAIGGVIK